MRVQTTTETLDRTKWPDAVAFREAIQTPSVALADPVLKSARVLTDRLGMPIAYTGRFAVVFRLRTPEGDWALRCFTHRADAAERRRRYAAIAEVTPRHPDCFVPLRYQEQGIRVAGEWYPVVAMRWAEGETLGRFVERHHRDPLALRRTADSLAALREKLESAGIAHGDWQHDNILVNADGSGLTLVDYDGMYVPELSGLTSREKGHPNYQHPGRTEADFGVGLDRFSCLAMCTALLALARDPSLWHRFSDGESILFKAADYADVAHSRVFAAISELAPFDEKLNECLEELVAACLDEARTSRSPVAGAEAPPVEKNGQHPWWMTGPQEVNRFDLNVTEAAPKTATVTPPESASVLLMRALMKEEIEFWAKTRKNALNVLIAVLLYIVLAISMRNSFAFFSVLAAGWIFDRITGDYDRWPLRRAGQELMREMERLEFLLTRRRKSLARARENVTVPDRFPNVVDYVRWKLKQVSIRTLLSEPYITDSTFFALQAERIADALSFRGRHTITGVSAGQMAVLGRWCDRLEQEAREEYNNQATPSLAPTPDTERARRIAVEKIEAEIRTLEAEQDYLRQQLATLSVPTKAHYLRLLVGLEQP